MRDVLTLLVVNIDFMKNLSAKFNLNSVTFAVLGLHSWECSLKITEIELESLTDVDMLLDYENGIKGEIARAICHYVEANNKYMHDHDETKGKIYIQYLDFNLSQLLSYGGFEYVRDISVFTSDFIINYDKSSDFGYALIVHVDYPEYLQPLYKDSRFRREWSSGLKHCNKHLKAHGLNPTKRLAGLRGQNLLQGSW